MINSLSHFSIIIFSILYLRGGCLQLVLELENGNVSFYVLYLWCHSVRICVLFLLSFYSLFYITSLRSLVFICSQCHSPARARLSPCAPPRMLAALSPNGSRLDVVGIPHVFSLRTLPSPIRAPTDIRCPCAAAGSTVRARPSPRRPLPAREKRVPRGHQSPLSARGHPRVSPRGHPHRCPWTDAGLLACTPCARSLPPACPRGCASRHSQGTMFPRGRCCPPDVGRAVCQRQKDCCRRRTLERLRGHPVLCSSDPRVHPVVPRARAPRNSPRSHRRSRSVTVAPRASQWTFAGLSADGSRIATWPSHRVPRASAAVRH